MTHPSGGRFDYKRPHIVEVCLDLAPPGGTLLIRTPAAGRLFGHQFTLRLRLADEPRKVPSASVDEPVADLFIG